MKVSAQKMAGVAAIAVIALGLALKGCGGHGKEVAMVGDHPVTAQEINAYLKFKRIPDTDQGRSKAALDQYLQREAIADAIEKTKVLDNGQIQAELEDFRTQMLISRYFQKFLDEKVTDAAVKNYYVAHPELYQQKSVHVAHILFRTNPKMSDAERKAKLTAAQEAYSKLKSGASFAKIAEKYSEDRISAKKGGDLGWLREGAIDPRFSKQVFGMKKGDISEPFETAFGFHIVKLIEGPMTVKRPFEAVRGDIRYQLRNEAKAAEIKRLESQISVRKY